MFTPKDNLEEYLTDSFNNKVYRNLAEGEELEGVVKKYRILFDPLKFFNLLYEQYDYILTNKKNATSIIPHLQDLNLWSCRYEYLLTILCKLYNENGKNGKDKKLDNCFDLIKYELGNEQEMWDNKDFDRQIANEIEHTYKGDWESFEDDMNTYANTLAFYADGGTGEYPSRMFGISQNIEHLYNLKKRVIIIAYFSKLKKQADIDGDIEHSKLYELEIEKFVEIHYEMGDYALMQVYLSLTGEGDNVTNTNKDVIAGKYIIDGKKLNGQRFYEACNKYLKTNARTEVHIKQYNDKKKERFEKVIKLLQSHPKALSQAIAEQKIFITNSEKKFD